ncbi:hypothetical protein Q3G72_020489 [Acer saccharum]|nr:hypothetical protein Q3G72_020489 [Acer saccharum]
MPPHHSIPFTSLLFKCKTIQQLKQTHAQLLTRGLNHPPPSLRPTISFSALNSSGDINYALLLLFQSSTPPQIFLYNTLIRGLARACRPDSLSTSLLVFYRMIDLNVVPNNFTFTFMFQNCANGGDFDLGRQLHGMVVKNSFAFDVFVRNSVIQFYSVYGKVRDARRNGRSKEALALYREMQLLDLEPNSAVLVSVLSACSQLGALDHGNWVYSYIRKKCMKIDSILCAALVDMYAKCGSIDLAMQNSVHKVIMLQTGQDQKKLRTTELSPRQQRKMIYSYVFLHVDV